MSRALRPTLTLWYIGILSAILLAFGGALYAGVATSLVRDLDTVLVLRARSVVDTIATFRKAEALALGVSRGNWATAPATTFLGEIRRGQLPELLDRWASKTNAMETGYPVRLIDRYGQPLLTSAHFHELNLPLPAAPVEQSQKARTSRETLLHAGQRLRVVTYPVMENTNVLYLVQAAASLAPVDDTVRRFGLWTFGLILLTLAVATWGGWFLAGRALQPVGLMVAQAQRIGAQSLDGRLPVPNTGDELERLAVTFNQLLARLESAFRQLRRFSAAASHELRTPLTVMRGELEVALRRPRTREEYHRVLEVHLRAAEKLSTIVEELLLLAYSEAADREIEWKPVELTELIREVSETWQPAAQAKSVHLDVSSQATVWVRGERRLLERLVANLLDNAVKYTPASGSITLTSECQDHLACLKVQDTGPGISPGDLPRLFDRFFTKRSPASAGTPSTGLGLGLCRWIAEAHRGRMEVSSTLGRGATFTIWLPATPPPTPS